MTSVFRVIGLRNISFLMTAVALIATVNPSGEA